MKIFKQSITTIVTVILFIFNGYGQIIKHNAFSSVQLGTQVFSIQDSIERKQTESPKWKYGQNANYNFSANLVLPLWGKQNQDMENGISPRFWYRRLGIFSEFNHVSLAGDVRNQTFDRFNAGIIMRDRLLGVDIAAGIGFNRQKYDKDTYTRFREYTANLAIYRPLTGHLYIDILMKTHFYKNNTWNGDVQTQVIFDLFRGIDRYGFDISEPIYHLGIGFINHSSTGPGAIIRYFPIDNVNITGTYNFMSQNKIDLKNRHVFELSLSYLFRGASNTTFPNVFISKRIRRSKKVECPEAHPEKRKK